MIRPLLCILAWSLFHQSAVADTGLLREVVRTDDAHILVFTAPASLRAGDAELVGVVNDPETGAPIDGVEIIVKARMLDWDSHRPAMVFATVEDEEIRMAHKSLLGLHSEGAWLLEVEVLLPDGEELVVPVEVAVFPAMSGWVSYGPVLLLWIPCMLLVLLRDRILRARATVLTA